MVRGEGESNFQAEAERQKRQDKLFGDWKMALELPTAFPTPVPPSIPDANDSLVNADLKDYFNGVRSRGLVTLHESFSRSAYYSGYSFIIIPQGQGATELAKANDYAHAISPSNQVPVLITGGSFEAADLSSQDSIKQKIVEEVLKRAVLKGINQADMEDTPGGGTRFKGYKFNQELINEGIVDGNYQVDLERALEYFGSAENIMDQLDDVSNGFTLRVDFSSPLLKENPVEFGLRTMRIFNAANEVLKNLQTRPDASPSYLQGFGPKEALDAISEVADVEFGTSDEHASLSVFQAWRMLLDSYPQHQDVIGTYVNSGLLGKAVTSGDNLPIDEIFKRFGQVLKDDLEKDPTSLHLGFNKRE